MNPGCTEVENSKDVDSGGPIHRAMNFIEGKLRAVESGDICGSSYAL